MMARLCMYAVRLGACVLTDSHFKFFSFVALDKASFLKKQNKYADIFLFFHRNTCCWYSSEAPQWCAPIEYPQYSQTSMARTSLGPWKFVREMGSSSQWDLIMAPGQETNGYIFGNVFDLQQNNGMLHVLIRITSLRQF